MEEKKQGKIKQSAAALAAGAAVLVSGVFTSPADLPADTMDRIAPPPAIELVLPDLPDEDPDEDLPVLSEEEKKKRGRFSAWYSNLSFFKRLLVSIAFAVLCWLAVGIAYFSIAPALPGVVGAVVRTGLILALSLLSYAAVAKALLPGTPLRKILSGKAILFVLIAGILLSVAAKFIFSSIFVHS